jgi:hypothetical protein
VGHEGKAALPRLSDRSRISQRAFGGASGNDEDAPFPAVRVPTIGRLKSTTLKRPFGTQGWRIYQRRPISRMKGKTTARRRINGCEGQTTSS